MVHVGKLELMSYIADDLSDIRKKEIYRHIGECSVCKEQLQLLMEQNQQFLKAFPPSSAPDTLVPTSTKSKSIWYQITTIAAVLLLSVTGMAFFFNTQQQFRTKGSNHIQVFRKNESGISELSPNSSCSPGDLLQFSYSVAEQNNFLLVSIDTSGKISQFFPINSDSSVEITSGADIPLPNSIKLDNYLGPELYVAVFSKQPFSVNHIEQYMIEEFRKHRSLDKFKLYAEKDFYIQQFLILKENSSK